MLWNRRESNAAYDPFAVNGQPSDKVVVISDWLKEIGGGVNTVMKDQVDCLSRDLGLAVDILMEGGDFDPPGTATFNTFPDPQDADSIYEILRQHIVEPAARGQRIAAVLHNVLTVPFSEPLTQAFRRLVEDVEQQPSLNSKIKFTAWTYDVFDVPDVMVSGVTYVVISESRQKSVAEYFRQPAESFPLVPCAVNLRRMLELSPEADWLFNTYALYDEDFVAFYPVRLAKNKNIDGAIKVVAALNRLGKKTTLLVPGASSDWERDYYNNLRDLASWLRIPEKIIFLTDLTFQGQRLAVSDRVVRDLYKLSSFLLFTSRDEGFGLPVIEAACWRLPLVISPLPPLESISEEAGVLVADFDQETPESIAERIVDYLRTNPAQVMMQRVFANYNMSRRYKLYARSSQAASDLPWRIGAQTTNHFRRWRIEDQFLDVIHNGMDAFEIFFDPQPQHPQGFNPENLLADVRDWLLENAAKHDVRLSVYARRLIRDRDDRRRHWEACLAFAREVGAGTIVIDLPPPEAFADGDFEDFLSDLQQLIDTASGCQIQTAIENGSFEDSDGACATTSADHLNDLFRRLAVDGKMVGVSFNAGRAHLREDLLSFLARIAPPIIHVKLSDNPGQGGPEVHQRLGEGSLPLQSLLQELKRREYRGTLVLEYFYPDLRLDRKLIVDQV